MDQNQRFVISVVTTVCVSVALCACSPKVDSGGYVHEEPLKDQIAIGQATREDVRTKLGSPSTQATFGEETWYYITQRKEAYAFLKPEVVKQEVTSIAFDDKGVVSKVDNYTLADGEDVTLVSRSTPTEGHTLGFFEQILGNVGRFNNPGNANNSSAVPGRQPGQ